MFRIIIVCAALLNGGAAFAFEGPCALASMDEAERVLSGAIVPMPPDEIGEETAPYCLWATAGRRAEVKLTIWSEAELPVLALPDAESYFLTLEAEAQTARGFVVLDGFGARAFEAGGRIVMLKTGRVIVLDFLGIAATRARSFAAQVALRL